jgi:uncharacterized protein (TIGR02452 family)
MAVYNQALQTLGIFHNMKNLVVDQAYLETQAEAWAEFCFYNGVEPPDTLCQHVIHCTPTYRVRHDPVNAYAAFTGKLSFEKGDMISAASLAASDPSNGLVGVLNMANPSRPGGGFCTGARAQEEQFCHRSTLLPLLKCESRHYPIKSGTALVTPGVTINLNEHFEPFHPTPVTVISAAAKYYQNETQAINDPYLRSKILITWKAIFAAAATAGVDTLIVSAIGAGAFHNPADIVAEEFINATKSAYFGGGSVQPIKHIRMIVLDDHNSNHNVARMQAVFEKHLNPDQNL